MAYNLIDKPDKEMVRWASLLYTRKRLLDAYVERGEPNINGWRKLISDLRAVAPLSALVAETWFNRIRNGEEI